MTYLNTHAPSGHARCRNLRCKEMYYQVDVRPEDGLAPVEDDREDRHVYWCVKTTKEYGPDRSIATLEDCSPERRCYEA